MVGVAVKVADAPEHIGFVPDVKAIDTDAVTFAFTVIDMEFDVAGLPLTQDALDVITQVMACPFVSVVVVYVVLLVPTLVPFTFH